MNTWAKRWLYNKNNRQKNDLICLQNTVARLKNLAGYATASWGDHNFFNNLV